MGTWVNKQWKIYRDLMWAWRRYIWICDWYKWQQFWMSPENGSQIAITSSKSDLSSHLDDNGPRCKFLQFSVNSLSKTFDNLVFILHRLFARMCQWLVKRKWNETKEWEVQQRYFLQQGYWISCIFFLSCTAKVSKMSLLSYGIGFQQ